MASIFSRIIAGEIPSYKVAEDENYYAFLDINPLTKGHTLVVPKKEIDYIFDLDDQTLAGMMLFAKKVAGKIKQEIACSRVAEDQVRADMQEAMDCGRNCPDPIAQKLWEGSHYAGSEPTLEEFILWVASLSQQA